MLQQKPGLPERLISLLLGSSLAVVLVTTKGFGSLLGLLVIVALFCMKPGEIARLRPQDRVFLLLLNTYPLLVALSMLAYGFGEPALFDNAARFLLLSVAYIAFRAKPYDVSYLVVGAMLGSSLTFCVSLMHLFQGVEVLQGSQARFVGFENPIVFAQLTFFLLLVSATPGGLGKLADSRARQLLIAVVLMASTSLVVSQSRGVLIALLGLCVYLLLFDPRLRSAGLIRYAFLLSAIASVVYLLNTPYLQHLGGTTAELLANYREVDQLTSMGQRMALWSSSWQLIAAKPLLGYGVGQFREALNSLPSAASLSETVRAYSHAHNDFLQIAVEYGLAGLAIFILSLLAIAALALREACAPGARHLLLGTLGAWFYFGLTQTQLAHQKTTMMFALLLTLGFSLGMNRKYGPLNQHST